MNISKYIPDRKIWGGGISAIAAWYLIYLATSYGIVLPPGAQEQISGAIGFFMAWLIPPSDQDKIKRLNDKLVDMAKNDPNIPVSK